MPKRSRNSFFPAFLSIELFSDCVDTGFDALNAVLINSRTGQAMAQCKAYFCCDSCCLQDFDAECDDLATIADRLLSSSECSCRRISSWGAPFSLNTSKSMWRIAEIISAYSSCTICSMMPIRIHKWLGVEVQLPFFGPVLFSSMAETACVLRNQSSVFAAQTISRTAMFTFLQTIV